MYADRYDNPLSTTSPAARDAYLDGMERFLMAAEGAGEAFERAIEADGNFAAAHLALGRNLQVLGKPVAAREAVARARDCTKGVTASEAGQIEALGLLVEGKVPAAYKAIRAHLMDYPRDVMVAQTCTGVFGLIGFSGQPGREAEQLAFTSMLAPHYGDDWWFLAQHAFSQMEAGQTGPAEATIEKSLDGNPRNANGAHIRAHLYYENGEAEAGAAYLDDWIGDYAKQGLLHCHISWHVALWALERGEIAKMWSVIDRDVDPGGAWGPAINVLTDLAAILYRAELAGVDVPKERWLAISRYASDSFPKTGLAFVDVHAALAHAMAGNREELDRIIADARGPAGDMVKILAKAFGALADGDWAGASVHLAEAMADHARIGGSRAQRDLIEFAMVGALLRQGKSDEARRLLMIRRPLALAARPVEGL